MLQVTPVVAVSPLLLIYLPQTSPSRLRLDRRLLPDPVEYDAGAAIRRPQPARPVRPLRRRRAACRLRRFLRPARPAALPYFLAGLKIAGGLALIGAVVAEIAAGSAGAGSGLAYRIVESQYRLNIPRLFAALTLLAAAGVLIFFLMSALSYFLLRHWHESALPRER